MKKRPTRFETKTLALRLYSGPAEDGAFAGYAAVFDEPDADGEIISPGAFAESLRIRHVVPLLFNHNPLEPIGLADCFEDDRGLGIEGTLNLELQRGHELRSLMKQGAVRGLSIGYQVHEEDRDRRQSARILRKIRLWEVSVVIFPAQQMAVIAEAKDGREPGDEWRLAERLESTILALRLLNLKLGVLDLNNLIDKEKIDG